MRVDLIQIVFVIGCLLLVFGVLPFTAPAVGLLLILSTFNLVLSRNG